MDFWVKCCLLLCSFGFFKELRPSEPFLTQYLLGPQHNLTEEQVNFQVYPVWTYSYLCLLVLVFLLTDLLRYKPVIVFEGLGYIATWSLLIWARGVHWMQLMEFTYGIATSTEVAYYTYIYAQVSGVHYQKVTSYTRTAILSGRFLSGVLAQVLFSTGLLDYYGLNFVSLASVCVACVLAFCLPPVSTSIYFHRRREGQRRGDASNECLKEGLEEQRSAGLVSLSAPPVRNNLKEVARLLWFDFREAYSDSYLLKWSFWWACATCINFQVGNYIQPLWETIRSSVESDDLYNGVVEAAATLLSALAALSMGHVRVSWAVFGEAAIGLISFLGGLLLLAMGLTDDIWLAYVGYVVFRASYQMLITIASFQVARTLRDDCYGLVFGVNMFGALVLQALLTLVLINILKVEPAAQFVVYGIYLGVLAGLFILLASLKFARMGCREVLRLSQKEEFPPASGPQQAPVGTTESI